MNSANLPPVTLTGLFPRPVVQANSLGFSNGQVIFAEGDAAAAMFRLESGFVKLSVAFPRNHRHATFILRPGDCFGEGGVLGDSVRTSTATSIQATRVSRIRKQEAMLRLKRPAVAKQFIAYLLVRIARNEANLVYQLMNSSEKRLARLLLQLAGIVPPHARTTDIMAIDQATLAQVVGTTRSRVSYFMNRFRKDGLIHYNGGLTVHPALQSYLLSN